MANYPTRFCFEVPFANEAAATAAAAVLHQMALAVEAAWEDGVEQLDPMLPGIPDPIDPGTPPTVAADGRMVTFEDEAGETDLHLTAAFVRQALHLPGCAVGHVGWTWASTCDRPRIDAFYGGACLVRRDALPAWRSTDQLLEEMAGTPPFPNEPDAQLYRAAAALYAAALYPEGAPAGWGTGDGALLEAIDSYLDALDARRDCPGCREPQLIGACEECGVRVPGPAEVPPAAWHDYCAAAGAPGNPEESDDQVL